VEAQWKGAHIPRIFTRRKFNSSLMRNWLAWSLEGEEICPPSFSVWSSDHRGRELGKLTGLTVIATASRPETQQWCLELERTT
jgi:hypothetical protein